MSLTRIEAELAASIERAEALREELRAADEWVAALRTSVDALRMLESTHAREEATRGQLIADAAWLILDVQGRRIKSTELVKMLGAQGIKVGHGDSETIVSDICTQLEKYGGGLVFSPDLGWGLAEWGGEMAQGPGPRQSADDTSDGSKGALRDSHEGERSGV
jgi:hypothetical protein